MTKLPKEPEKLLTIEEQRTKLRNQLLQEFEEGGNEPALKHISLIDIPNAEQKSTTRTKFLEKWKKWEKIDKEDDERMGITPPKKRKPK